MARYPLAIGLLAGCLLVGCGSGLETPADVSGTVLLNATPLPDGEILFEDVDGKKAPVSTKIENGKYQAKVLPGVKKVVIRASRPAGKIDPLMKQAVSEQYLAEEFNEKSRLTAEIKPGEQDNVNFTVRPAR